MTSHRGSSQIEPRPEKRSDLRARGRLLRLLNGGVGFLQRLAEDPARVVFVFATAGILSLSIVGLPLAIIGAFRPALVLPPAIILWSILGRYWNRLSRATVTRTSKVTSALAVIIAVAFGAFTAAHSGEHLLNDRDPGVYLITGAWLAAHGDLRYDPGVPEGIVLSTPQSWAPGIHGAADGRGYFQFQHAPGVVLATAHWVGGASLMFRAMAIVTAVGLLGIYVLGRSLAGPSLGLFPAAVAAVHPAFVHIAKDGYSEPMALVFALAALWTWLLTAQFKNGSALFTPGLLLGAGVLTRIDGWLTAIGFFAGLAYLALTGGENARIKRLGTMWLFSGFLSTAVLGLIDLTTRSPVYLRDLSSEATPMMAMLAGTVAVAMILGSPRPLIRRLGQRVRRFAPPAVGVGVLIAGLFALFLRPRFVVHGRRPIGLVAGLQEREGLEVDPLRTYAEMSAEWLARYQGHLPIVLGIGAMSVAAYVILRREGDRRTPVLAASLTVMSVYLWQPSITPDHLWALRRFLPVVLPLGFVLTALGVRLIMRRFPASASVTLGIAGIMAITITHSLVVGWPIATNTTHVGVLGSVHQACGLLPENAVVLHDAATRPFVGPIRLICDVPMAPDDEGALDRALDAGLNPVLLSSQHHCTAGSLGVVEGSYVFPQLTLSIPPKGPETRTYELWFVDAGPRAELLGRPPETAEIALYVELETTWVPDEGYALIAAIGSYAEGMWLQYGPNGVVEVWIATDQGFFGAPASPFIADGRRRTVGGHLLDGVLYGACGGQENGSIGISGDLLSIGGEIDLNPDVADLAAMQAFDGLVEVATTQPELPNPGS